MKVGAALFRVSVRIFRGKQSGPGFKDIHGLADIVPDLASRLFRVVPEQIGRVEGGDEGNPVIFVLLSPESRDRGL